MTTILQFLACLIAGLMTGYLIEDWQYLSWKERTAYVLVAGIWDTACIFATLGV